MTSVIYI